MRPNPQETADLVTFTEQILHGKLHFLCSVFRILLYFNVIVLDVQWLWFLKFMIAANQNWFCVISTNPPKWILNLLSVNQSQSMLKFLFSAALILVIFLCWNITQVSSAYNNSAQSTACGISFVYNRKGRPK